MKKTLDKTVSLANELLINVFKTFVLQVFCVLLTSFIPAQRKVGILKHKVGAYSIRK